MRFGSQLLVLAVLFLASLKCAAAAPVNASLPTTTDVKMVKETILLQRLRQLLRNATLNDTVMDDRKSRFVDPVLLKLLISTDDLPPPGPPPWFFMKNGFGGLSDKAIVDLAMIGGYTLLGLALISKFPVQISENSAPPAAVQNHILIQPIEQISVEVPYETTQDMMEVTSTTSETIEQPEVTEPDVTEEEMTVAATTPEIPMFLKVLVNFVSNDPVQVDIVNDGDFQKNYTYREARNKFVKA